MSEGFGMNRNHIVEVHEMVGASSGFSTGTNHFPNLGKMVWKKEIHSDSVVREFRDTQLDRYEFRCKFVIKKTGKGTYHV
ncbi:MAG: hypothetical protein BMS9Abin25_0572 [Gammaproteobacteria bacterium]|nr:MAG: hypothetical protein BMS9Abin25_0572 [Gammaproteobacteria bacterium]